MDGIYNADLSKLGKYYPQFENNLNDQYYNIWIPVHYKKEDIDEYYMIDTYQVSLSLYHNCYSNKIEEVYESYIKGLKSLKFPKYGNQAIYNCSEYFYSAAVKLDNNIIDLFSLRADLRKYRLNERNEYKDYNEADVVKYVKLYSGHNYSLGGVIFIRRNAKIDFKNKIDTRLDNILDSIKTPDFCNEFYIKEVLDIEKEAIKSKSKYNKKRLDDILKLNQCIKGLYKQYIDFITDNDINIYRE